MIKDGYKITGYKYILSHDWSIVRSHLEGFEIYLPYDMSISLHLGDVKKAIVFGRTHNMRVVTKSSGHCLVGRSSVAGSLTIYLRKMRNITVNMADSGSDTGASLTAGPGANWIEIYEVVGLMLQLYSDWTRQRQNDGVGI